MAATRFTVCREKALQFAVFSLSLAIAVVWHVTYAIADAPNGNLVFVYSGNRCIETAKTAEVSAEMLPNAGTVTRATVSISSGRSTLSIPQGAYWVRIATRDCDARFPIAAFSGVSRTVSVSLTPLPAENGNHEDPFIVPDDFVAIALPMDGMKVVARLENGPPFTVLVQGRYAFIDFVPPGRLTVTVSTLRTSKSKSLESIGGFHLYKIAF